MLKPEDLSILTPEEQYKEMESLTLLTEKRYGSAKVRTCANRSAQRSCTTKDEDSSPAAAVESSFLTRSMTVEEERGIMMIGMSSAFLQASFPNNDSKEKVMMKPRVALAGTLDEISPGVRSKHVAYQNDKKALHASVLKSSNIMLKASTLH